MTRWLPPGEETVTATEMAQRIEKRFGHVFTAGQIGVAAKALDLDYEEVDFEVAQAPGLTVKQKRYGVEDMADLVLHLLKKR